MRLLNSNTHYGLISKLLHWSTAISMFSLIGLGWYMVDLSYYDRWYNASLSWHRSLGILVFFIGLAMLIWKSLSQSPENEANFSAWQRTAAKFVHWLLLSLVIGIPVTGFLVSTSAGKPVNVFNWFEMPVLIQVNDSWRELIIAFHYYLSYGVGLIALGHATAAIKHQFVDRDGTLARMLWR